VDTNAHVEADAVPADANRGELAVSPGHRNGRGNRAPRVILSGEEEQQGVAPELHIAATVLASDIEHAVEVAVYDVREPLRAFLANLGQPF
jgi:hypothetical protein